MSREIKFRGKATCRDRWVYGCYVECDGGYYIVEKIGGDSVAKIQVIPETVGQSTGRHDKNGKEIYDSDILTTHKGRRPQLVFWQTDIGQWRVGYRGRKTQFDKTDTLMFANHFKVIGNIHDNPELLEK